MIGIAADSAAARAPPRRKVTPMPNAFITIAPDNTVTVHRQASRHGPGHLRPASPTIVADELDADWPQMRIEFAPANATLYNNLLFGPGAGHRRLARRSRTPGTSCAGRRRGARDADRGRGRQWKVPAAEITIAKGVVTHAIRQAARRSANSSPKAATLAGAGGGHAEGAEGLRVYIGKARAAHRLRGQDRPARRIYALDIRRPGMLTAVVAHPPRFGGTVKSFDASGRQGGQGRASTSCRFAERRRGAGDGLLVGDAGPRRAEGGMG